MPTKGGVYLPNEAVDTAKPFIQSFTRSTLPVRHAMSNVLVDPDSGDPIIAGGSPMVLARHDSIALLIATATRLGPYRRVFKWSPPTGYRFHPTHFESWAATAGSPTLLSVIKDYGTYNLGTSTWFDGSVAATTTRLFNMICLEVVTALSAVVTTLTTTVSPGGLTTSGATIAASAGVSNVYVDFVEAAATFPWTVAATDITSVQENPATAATGLVRAQAYYPLAYHRQGAATREQSDVSPGSIWIGEADALVVDMGAAAITAQERFYSIDGIMTALPA